MKQKPVLVVMLTYNDVTVKNAAQVFDSCKELPVQHWGFKNVGLPKQEMKQLVQAMKDNGKTTYLEVVTYDEASCLEAAQTAVDCGFDKLMGTIYYDSVHEYLKKNNMEYSPFVGQVSGSPSILEGEYQDIVDQAVGLIAKGVNAFDLLAYRHVVNGEELARYFTARVPAKVCIAGSISSYERIDTMFDIAPWGFTMGSALFDKKFVKNGNFHDNLAAVADYMSKHS